MVDEQLKDAALAGIAGMWPEPPANPMTFDYLSLFRLPADAAAMVGLCRRSCGVDTGHDRGRSRSILHRGQAHHALELHTVVSHFFRFWLWLTTGMVTKGVGCHPPQAPRQSGNA
jgi:hypothetical protein